MELADKAVEYHKSGYNCSQAVIAAYAPALGLEKDKALQIAAGFGGGMRMGGACGALTGAFMVLGMKYGATEASDQESKANTYKIIQKATEKFNTRFSSANCIDLLGYDLGAEGGFEQAKKAGALANCNDYIRAAAEILEEMLDEPRITKIEQRKAKKL